MKLELMPHQVDVLDKTKAFNRCAHFLKMGLGKTFTGAEKLNQLGAEYNLLICQKSKIQDWIDHFKQFYPNIPITDFTTLSDKLQPGLMVVNYELAWRRPILKTLEGFTLMLDESSNIMHDNTKQTKFIKNLKFENLILLSGTPCGGRYELLIPQLNMLGWNISKRLFVSQYCVTEKTRLATGQWISQIVDYKNIDRLKRKTREYGCVWMETEEAIKLPPVIDQNLKVPAIASYWRFIRDCIVTINDVELVGDTPLKKLLYARQLCGVYATVKVNALLDLINSTDDRTIVFYNFTDEFNTIVDALRGIRPLSVINGATKDLTAYQSLSDSVTFIQYQSGAMGLNLQKANRIVYFTPPLRWELFEQSKARIARIGQEKTCFYYYLICKNSVEEKIYKMLSERKDYDETLFEKDYL